MTSIFPLTGFETETVKNMRDRQFLLKDAQMMAALIVEMTTGGCCIGCEVAEPEALNWLSRRLRDQLDLISAHGGDKSAPGWMQPEAGA